MILGLQKLRRLFYYLIMASLSLCFWGGSLLFTNHRIYCQQNIRCQRENISKRYKNKQRDLLHLRENILLYHQAKKEGLLARHDRQKLQKILEEQATSGNLSSLHFKISCTQRRVFSCPKSKITFVYRATPISLTFDHSQDVDIFKFMEALPDHLPGLVIPEQLALQRTDFIKNKKESGLQGRYDFYLVTWDEHS